MKENEQIGMEVVIGTVPKTVTWQGAVGEVRKTEIVHFVKGAFWALSNWRYLDDLGMLDVLCDLRVTLNEAFEDRGFEFNLYEHPEQGHIVVDIGELK